VFEVTVMETISYAAHIEATDQAQAERAVESMDENDWDPIRESAQLEKYGYEINGRRWSVMSVERTDFIRMLDKEELLISAEEWDQD